MSASMITAAPESGFGLIIIILYCEFLKLLSRKALSWVLEEGPIPDPDIEADFTSEAKKVIRFAKLHPLTKRLMLKDHLGENVEYLFPDTMTKSSLPTDASGKDLPPLPSLASRKRKVVQTPSSSKAVKSGTATSASNVTSSAVTSSSPSSGTTTVSAVLQPSSSTNISLSCGTMSSKSSPSMSLTASASHPAQVSTSSGLAGTRTNRASDGSATWRPQFKDLSKKMLTVGHTGCDNSPVAGLVQNAAILPKDAEFFEQQTSAFLALLSTQSRYNANAADHALSTRLLRYEDYINNICDSIGCTRNNSILSQLNKLKADAEKAKEAPTRIAELEAALEKTKESSAKISALQADLDKARAETVVAQASIERLKANKDLAVNELVTVKLELAKEKSLRGKAETGLQSAEETIALWEPKHNLAGEKMNAIFDVISPHMETCRPFRDEVRPFLEKYESESIPAFDAETYSMDRENNIESPVVDKPIVTQTYDIVDISTAKRRDQDFAHPDDPSNNQH